MGNTKSSMVVVPDRDVMITLVDRLVSIESMIKKGQQLTRVQELERKELIRIAKVMKQVQKRSVKRLGNLLEETVSES